MDMHFEGVIFQTHAEELRRRLEHPYPPFMVLDLREQEEFALGHIPGAHSVSLETLEKGLPPAGNPTTEYFLVGSGPEDERVRRASLELKQQGAQRRVELRGGMLEWRTAGYPEEKGVRGRRTPVLFWDVDTQADFMDSDGKLYVQGAEEIRPRLERLAATARRRGIPVVASGDAHRPEDPEITEEPDFQETFPPHCMAGTAGAERIPETAREWNLELDEEPVPDERLRQISSRPGAAVLIRKRELDVFSNPNADALLRATEPESVVVYGVATDFCVRCAVEGLLARGVQDLTLVTDAIRGIDEDRSSRLLGEWRARGVELRTTEELLKSLDGA
jgi:nicotinamidase/pyrazinamidase